MKRTLLYILTILVLVSCQRDPDIPIVSLTVQDKVEAEWLTANLSGAVSANTKVDDLFVQWSADESFGAVTEVQATYNDGQFVAVVTNLSPQTTYYYRYRVTNKLNAFNEQTIHSFKTKDIVEPIVNTTEITNITYVSAACGGNVTSDGGTNITERGICYATTTNPTTGNTKVTSGTGTGSFSCNLTGLTNGKTYYVRAYAINSKGTSYGEEKTFTTSAYNKPTITTTEVTNITATSATCGGTVTSDGGQSVMERGICYATTTNPTTGNTKVTSGTGTGSFSCNLTGLIDDQTYYVRAYAINSKGTSYGEVKSFTTNGTEAGHEWIDLGLSVKWATMNVGATTVTGYGNYYAWGETSTKKNYGWSTYKYCNGSYNSMTKYCTSSKYGIVDNKTTLDPTDDAAHVNWGGNWRMPTHAELVELCDNCTNTWTDNYQGTGVAGRIFTSPKTGMFIFLPAGNSRDDADFFSVGWFGEYWSSSLYESDSSSALGCVFSPDYEPTKSAFSRRYGQSIRAVCP